MLLTSRVTAPPAATGETISGEMIRREPSCLEPKLMRQSNVR
jgi:hypothetical protein